MPEQTFKEWLEEEELFKDMLLDIGEEQKFERKLLFIRKAKRVSRRITKRTRYKVLKRQDWRCNECGEKLIFDSSSTFRGKVAHIDHIHPFSKRHLYPNGILNINEITNLQALCPECNRLKRDQLCQ